MPLDTMGYLFTNFNILSISLPVGLNWVCNSSANGCNYNPQVNQYGCVNVYGTPLLAGQYNIDVTVIADLNIVQGVPVTFQVYMEVLPSNTSVTNTGFSMLGSTGCLPITVNFTNNNPGLLAYEWDFGNGNTSSLENPCGKL
jgi:PKD repeat protein